VFDGHYPILILPRHIGMVSIQKILAPCAVIIYSLIKFFIKSVAEWRAWRNVWKGN
jgi:hypothetical protein